MGIGPGDKTVWRDTAAKMSLIVDIVSICSGNCYISTAIETQSSIKSDLIDIECIDQSVEIDDTLVSINFDLSWFFPISSIYIGRYISSLFWDRVYKSERLGLE